MTQVKALPRSLQPWADLTRSISVPQSDLFSLSLPWSSHQPYLPPLPLRRNPAPQSKQLQPLPNLLLSKQAKLHHLQSCLQHSPHPVATLVNLRSSKLHSQSLKTAIKTMARPSPHGCSKMDKTAAVLNPRQRCRQCSTRNELTTR